MATDRPVVVLGFVGNRLDAGSGEARHRRWRPTRGLVGRPDLRVDRLELLTSGDEDWSTLQADLDVAAPAVAVRLHPLPLPDPWDFEAVYDRLFAWARSYPFDPEHEDYLVHITTGSHVVQICWFLLVESRHVPARLLQQAPPAPGRVHGPLRQIDLDLSAYSRITARHADDARDATAFLKTGIATQNAAYNALIDQIAHVAVASRDPLLLTGPTGVGKTQLARRIHALRKDRHIVTGPLVEVNCATLRGDGAMSTLFGHRRGAFTGAVSDRPGLLRAADGGLLFLDEIGELGLDEQAMLLHALEDGRFLPVGADTAVTSQFLLIAGTNRDLRQQVAAGTFRQDLLTRIQLWSYRLPALRERLEDLEPNLDHELRRFAELQGRQVRLTAPARAAYLDFARAPDAVWSGNFRDLNASVRRMATLAHGGRIRPEDVAHERLRLRTDWGLADDDNTPQGAFPVDATLPVDQPLDLFDAVQLRGVLAVCRDAPSLSAAGRALFAVSRLTRRSRNDADRLRKYLARFGLTWEQLPPRPTA